MNKTQKQKQVKKLDKGDSVVAFLLGIFGGLALGRVLEHAMSKYGYIEDSLVGRTYFILTLRNIAAIFMIGAFFGILICLAAIGIGELL